MCPVVEVPNLLYVTATPFVPIPIVPLVPSTKKVLEIEAVIPDEDATSKKASGVTSPSPNLPSEVEEKMPKAKPELS